VGPNAKFNHTKIVQSSIKVLDRIYLPL